MAVPDVAAQCLHRIGELAAHARDLDHERLLVGIGHHDPAAGPGDAEQLVERRHRVGEVHQDPIGPAAAERRIGERELFGEPLADAPDVWERPRAHRPRSIDADRLLGGNHRRVLAGAAAKVEDVGLPSELLEAVTFVGLDLAARRRRAASRPRLCGSSLRSTSS